MQPQAGELGRRIVARLDALAAITDEPGQITRLYLSPAHRRAVETVTGWMRDAGMQRISMPPPASSGVILPRVTMPGR